MPAAPETEAERLYAQALEFPEGKRAAFLDDSCSDPELRREVERLLAASVHSTLVNGTLLAGRFRVSGRLGKGGMGEVFEAEDLELGGRLAIKRIRLDVARDRDAAERFR